MWLKSGDNETMNNMQLRMHAQMRRDELLSALRSAMWKIIRKMDDEGLSLPEAALQCPAPDGVSEGRWLAALVTFINRNGELE